LGVGSCARSPRDHPLASAVFMEKRWFKASIELARVHPASLLIAALIGLLGSAYLGLGPWLLLSLVVTGAPRPDVLPGNRISALTGSDPALRLTTHLLAWINAFAAIFMLAVCFWCCQRVLKARYRRYLVFVVILAACCLSIYAVITAQVGSKFDSAQLRFVQTIDEH
jgi:hypothetical protein